MDGDPLGWHVDDPDTWSEIIDGLWQGGDTPSPVGRFDHVVSLCAWTEGYSPGPEGQAQWFIADGPIPDGIDEIWALAHDISERLDRGEQVLVRCQMGLNRSGLLVAAVLIDRGWEPSEAIERVRTRRSPYALSNPHFEEWLLRGMRP